MKLSFCIFNLLFQGFLVHAQTHLKPGNYIPDWQFKTLMNSPVPTISLSEYKGKAILMVFWNTGCTSNFDIMPILESFQQEFKNSLQVILVAEDEKEKVNTFFSKRISLKKLGLLMVAKDTSFSRLFPHSAIPHVIFVGKDGKIRAANDPSYISTGNINSLVNGKDIDVPPPIVEKVINSSKSFISNNLINDTNVLCSSVLAKSFANVAGQMVFRKTDNSRRKVYLINSTVQEMYSIAYEAKMNAKLSDVAERVIVKENGLTLNKEIAAELLNNEKYSYELVMPEKFANNNLALIDYMRTDLDRYFQYESKVEKIKTKCYVLKKIHSSFNVNNKERYTQKWLNSIEFNNEEIVSISSVLQDLSLLDHPLLVEECSDDNFTLVINKHYVNIETLNKELKKGGLSLTVEERELNFLVINIL